MPKVILDVEKKIVNAAKDLYQKEGFAGLSMRRVAGECSIAVGTIYNYFPDKMSLLAGIMIRDWREILKEVEEGMSQAASLVEGIRYMYLGIQQFVQIYQGIWEDGAVSKMGGASIYTYHPILRKQLVDMIHNLLGRLERMDLEAIEILLAEAVLTSSLQKDITYTMLQDMVMRLEK